MVLAVKNLSANAGGARDMGLLPESESSSGEGQGNPLQYSCRENPMDRGACWATVHGIAKSRTQLKWFSTCMYNINTQYLSFSFWISLYSSPRFIHLVRTDSNVFFLWLSNIPLCICTTISVSILLSVDIYVVSMSSYWKKCCNEHWGICISLT